MKRYSQQKQNCFQNSHRNKLAGKADLVYIDAETVGKRTETLVGKKSGRSKVGMKPFVPEWTAATD